MARKGVYTATFVDVSVAALQDLFEITAADDEPVELIGVFISQRSDLGDAEEEGLRIDFVRGNTSSGSGGSAVTERATHPQSGAASAVVEANNTTEASAGTEEILHSEVWNIRMPFQWIPTPDMEIVTNQGAGLLCVRLLTAPTDTVTASGTIYWREG